MVIETKHHGSIEVDESSVLTFPNGIYGFEETRQFVLITDDKKPANPFMWLQNTQAKDPCFVVVDPKSFYSEYNPEIGAEDASAISLRDPTRLRYLLIATVPADVKNMYINLKCPIIINSEERTAMQVILENTEYPMKHYLLQKKEG